MWINKAFFLHFLALLLMSDALPNRHDQCRAGSRRAHLQWRQNQPLRNETRTSETIRPTSKSSTAATRVVEFSKQTQHASVFASRSDSLASSIASRSSVSFNTAGDRLFTSSAALKASLTSNSVSLSESTSDPNAKTTSLKSKIGTSAVPRLSASSIALPLSVTFDQNAPVQSGTTTGSSTVVQLPTATSQQSKDTSSSARFIPSRASKTRYVSTSSMIESVPPAASSSMSMSSSVQRSGPTTQSSSKKSVLFSSITTQKPSNISLLLTASQAGIPSISVLPTTASLSPSNIASEIQNVSFSMFSKVKRGRYLKSSAYRFYSQTVDASSTLSSIPVTTVIATASQVLISPTTIAQSPIERTSSSMTSRGSSQSVDIPRSKSLSIIGSALVSASISTPRFIASLTLMTTQSVRSLPTNSAGNIEAISFSMFSKVTTPTTSAAGNAPTSLLTSATTGISKPPLTKSSSRIISDVDGISYSSFMKRISSANRSRTQIRPTATASNFAQPTMGRSTLSTGKYSTSTSSSSAQMPDSATIGLSVTTPTPHSIITTSSFAVIESTPSFSGFANTRSGNAAMQTQIMSISTLLTSISTHSLPTTSATAMADHASSIEFTHVGTATILNVIGNVNTKGTSSTPIPSATLIQTAPTTVPPLKFSPTVGIAVGSTVGVLLAFIAAVFVTRRFMTKEAEKRNSTRGINPKGVYANESSNEEGDGGSGGDESAIVSGGNGGGLSPVFPRSSFGHNQHHSTGFMGRYSNGGDYAASPASTLTVPDQIHKSSASYIDTPSNAVGLGAATAVPRNPVPNQGHRRSKSFADRYTVGLNPFRDSENTFSDSHNFERESFTASNGAAAMLVAATSGYAASSPTSSIAPEHSISQSLRNLTTPSPALRSPTANPNIAYSHERYSKTSTYSNDNTPVSLYALQTDCFAPLTEAPSPIPYTPEFAENSFKYDLLMPVVPHGDSTDSVHVCTMPLLPLRPAARSPKAADAFATEAQFDRFTLAYDVATNQTYLRPATKPGNPSAFTEVPQHLSSDTIPLSSEHPASLKAHMPAISIKKKPLPQLKRKEPDLADSGQAMSFGASTKPPDPTAPTLDSMDYRNLSPWRHLGTATPLRVESPGPGFF